MTIYIETANPPSLRKLVPKRRRLSRGSTAEDIREMSFDAEIDYQHQPSKWSQRENTCEICVQRITEYSDKYREQHGEKIRTVCYGDLGPRQKMDIVTPEDVEEDSPIVMFVHGGYWVESGREMYTFTAKKAADNGWIAAIAGYDQAPNVPLTTIVEEIRQSYIFLCRQFPKSRGINLFGHSAGGHLVAMLLATDWTTYGSSEHLIPIRYCAPISGLFDLRPIVHVSYNEHLKLSKSEIEKLSPFLNISTAVSTIKQFNTEVTSVVAEFDPPSFKKQGSQYVEALSKAGVRAKQIELANFDHFDIIEQLSDPGYSLHEIILKKGD